MVAAHNFWNFICCPHYQKSCCSGKCANDLSRLFHPFEYSHLPTPDKDSRWAERTDYLELVIGLVQPGFPKNSGLALIHSLYHRHRHQIYEGLTVRL